MVRAPDRAHHSGKLARVVEEDAAAIIGPQRCQALISARCPRMSQVTPQGKGDDMDEAKVRWRFRPRPERCRGTVAQIVRRGKTLAVPPKPAADAEQAKRLAAEPGDERRALYDAA